MSERSPAASRPRGAAETSLDAPAALLVVAARWQWVPERRPAAKESAVPEPQVAMAFARAVLTAVQALVAMPAMAPVA